MNDQYIYGINAFEEALNAGKTVEKVFFLKENFGHRLIAIRDELKKLEIPFSIVPKIKFKGIAKENHQGIIAMISPIQYFSLDNLVDRLFSEGKDPFLLIADSITDIRNIGAICRTAQAFGCHGIITPLKGGALLNSEAIKASSGALLSLPVVRVDGIKRAVKFLQDSGLTIISITEKSEKSLFGFDFNSPLAIVLGSEGKGVSTDILNISNEMLSIPMQSGVGSLNVSVATGIACSEIYRSRLK